ncbi:MAG: M23 family metallopeptidase, partial [Sneathiellaceae bacterium]
PAPSPRAQPAHAPAPRPAIAAPPPRSGKPFGWPLTGRIISRYGAKDGGLHNDGINIAARSGDPVVAAENGVVVYSGNELAGFGNLLLLRHGGGWVTAYAHNDSLLVKRGESVNRGQIIARAGRTGSVSAPQLHFEIRQGKQAVDPMNHLPQMTTMLTGTN